MSNGVDWEDQRAFLAVLQTGSLSGAARRLGVAQPTVRARIEALERALGTVLFTRSARGLLPTEHARSLGAAAEAMARASDSFVRRASAPDDAAAGTVRISVPELIGIEVLPPMLARLRARHPALTIELVLSNVLANIREQEVDLAVRTSAPAGEGLVARKVATIPLGLFAHADYLRRRGFPATEAALAGHDLIGPDRSALDLAFLTARFPGLARASFVLRTDSHPAQLAAARAGLGIAIVQRPLGLADPALRPVLPSLVAMALDAWLVTHADLRALPRVRMTFDFLAAAFRAYALSNRGPGSETPAGPGAEPRIGPSAGNQLP